MVLVGLGEDFDNRHLLRENAEYIRGCEMLKAQGYAWLIPAWGEYCSEKLGNEQVRGALEGLTRLLEEKNYFVVSVSTNSLVADNPWKHGRLVMPCGTVLKKQCAGGCGDVLSEITEADREKQKKLFDKLSEGIFPDIEKGLFGICPKCGEPLVLNHVYADHYNEEGYLEQWKLYTKWLQGTLNRRLFVLELGVGMGFPSVVRWPFEKVVFFNQKAFLCRVNEKLYQLTEELAGKGCGISQNAIDWSLQL